MNPHHEEHQALLELAKFPPLSKKSVRRRYLELVRNWEHSKARRKYGALIVRAEKYWEMSEGSSVNAHMFFFRDNKSEKQEDYWSE